VTVDESNALVTTGPYYAKTGRNRILRAKKIIRTVVCVSMSMFFEHALDHMLQSEHQPRVERILKG
jgi:hypothetical protein